MYSKFVSTYSRGTLTKIGPNLSSVPPEYNVFMLKSPKRNTVFLFDKNLNVKSILVRNTFISD